MDRNRRLRIVPLDMECRIHESVPPDAMVPPHMEQTQHSNGSCERGLIRPPVLRFER